MEERKKPLLSLRTLIDLVLGGVCIVLLWMMLGQLDALKKIEADMDRLRAQVEAKKSDQVRPVDQTQGSSAAKSKQ